MSNATPTIHERPVIPVKAPDMPHRSPSQRDFSPNSDNQPKAENPFKRSDEARAKRLVTASGTVNPFRDAVRRAVVDAGTSTVTALYVKPWWDAANGCIKGIVLTVPDGNYDLHALTADAAPALDKLNPPLHGQHDYRRGEWRINYLSTGPQGDRDKTIKVISVEEIKPMAAQTTIPHPPMEGPREKLDRLEQERLATLRAAALSHPANPDSDDVDEALGRKAADDASVSPDEPKTAEWVKDTAKKNTFFGRWVKMCDEFQVPADKDLREGLRKATIQRLTGHDSLTWWERSAAELLTELNKDLLAKYGDKAAGTVETPPAAVVVPETPKSGLVAPSVNAEKGIPMTYPNWPESPVVVYPMQNGGVRYKGVKFSVTLRFGGSIDMAIPLMDDFLEKARQGIIEIDPSCIYAQIGLATQANAPVAPQSVAPAPAPVTPPAPAPAQNGNGSGGTEHICQVVMHSQNTADGVKVTYDLIPTINGAPGKFKLLTLRQTAALMGAGVPIADIKPEVPFPVSLTATWTKGKEYQPGKFYKDLISLVAA